MFGFIVVDKDTINPRDYAYFNSFYCGLCFIIKKRYGNKMRMFNNFDSTFAFTLLASYLKYPILITSSHCAVHWFKKINRLQFDNFEKRNLTSEQIEELNKLVELGNKIADATILLVKGKILDDIEDKECNSKIKYKLYKKAFDFAMKQNTELNEIIITNTRNTIELEKENSKNIELLANFSGQILKGIPKSILKENSNIYIEDIFYELGKWIYYIDAVYDLEKDYKKHKYNPFIAKYGDYQTRQEFISKHKFEILSYLNSCLDNIKASYKMLKSTEENELINNFIYKGLIKQQTTILTNPNQKLFM